MSSEDTGRDESRSRAVTDYLDIPGSSARLAVRLDEPATARPGQSGSAILYFHGFGASQEGEKAEYFRARALGDGYAFCSLDFRAHGASGGGLDEISLATHLEDALLAHDFLARHGYPRPVVLGSSFGGLTGLWHAALHPDRVAGGLFVAPAVDLGDRTRAWAGEEGLEQWRRSGRRRVVTPVVDGELGWSFVEAFDRYPTDELARRLRTPVLLLQGRLDDQVSWRSVTDFAATCSAAPVELHLFSDGDHRLVDRKPLLWRLMKAFLEPAP